jgi:hypothetical protein
MFLTETGTFGFKKSANFTRTRAHGWGKSPSTNIQAPEKHPSLKPQNGIADKNQLWHQCPLFGI